MIESDLFKSLFDIIPFEIYVVDVANYEIVYMNRTMIQGRGNLIGQTCHKLIFGEEKPCHFCKIDRLLDEETGLPSDKTLVFEIFNPVNDKWYQLQEKAITWPDGRIVKYSIGVNISELKETQNRLAEAHAELALKNKELEKISVTDSLTGLSNRFRIEEVLENSLYAAERYGRMFSLIMLDIDHFKLVNDRFGHLVGDEVLKKIASVISENVRKSDSTGRWGGEEFLIVSMDTDPRHCGLLAEKLRANIASAVFDTADAVTVSLGVTGYGKGDDRVSVIKRVDAALYRAKETGRNRVVIDDPGSQA